MTDTPRTTEIVGRDEINDLEEILMLGPPPVDEIIREIQADGAIRFTWDYDQARPALEKLYEKAKRSQWNAATDIDWSQDVDPERIARGLLEAHPEMLLYQQKAKDDPTIPIYGWTDEQFVQLAIEYQTQFLSQIVHGEQGALMCTAKICEQVPWLEAKYYASTQVMDEARHVEVFSRYLDTKLRGHHPISGHLLALLEDVLGDATVGHHLPGHADHDRGPRARVVRVPARHHPRPVAQDDPALRDERRGAPRRLRGAVAGRGLPGHERRGDQGPPGVRLRGRACACGIARSTRTSGSASASTLAPSCAGSSRTSTPRCTAACCSPRSSPTSRSSGLLDAGDGWLRQKYTEMGIIQYEDWIDTSEEYAALDAVDPAS